jgi:hypothetical protein
LVRDSGSIQFGIKKLKNIPVCDLFYCVVLDTVGPLPKTKFSNKYVLVATDHYSKWCEARFVKEHIVELDEKFLEKEIICRFRVPKYVLTDNGKEWMAEFDMMCKNCGITH